MRYALLLLILIACNPSKQIDKLSKKHTDLFLARADSIQPCGKGGSDTTETTDSSVWKETILQYSLDNEKLFKSYDSVLNLLGNPIIIHDNTGPCCRLADTLKAQSNELRNRLRNQKPVKPITNTIRIRDTIPDSRQTRIWMDKANELQSNLNASNKSRDGWKQKARLRNWMNIASWILNLLFLFIIFKRKR